MVYERKESRARSRLLVRANGKRTCFFSEMGRQQKLHIWEGERRRGCRHVIPKYNLICLKLCSLFHFWTILEKYLTHYYSHIYTPHIHTYMSVLVAQSCPTLCDPMDCSLLGSSVHGILQARILERVAIRFSRGSSRPKDQTRVSCVAGKFFTV